MLQVMATGCGRMIEVIFIRIIYKQKALYSRKERKHTQKQVHTAGDGKFNCKTSLRAVT